MGECSMEKSDLCEKMESLITSCEARYEAAKNDSYRSTVFASKREALQTLLERAENGETEEQLRAELKAKLPELEEEMEKEAEYPTFDWYDEHHVYKVMEGRRDAYREVIAILEETADE